MSVNTINADSQNNGIVGRQFCFLDGSSEVDASLFHRLPQWIIHAFRLPQKLQEYFPRTSTDSFKQVPGSIKTVGTAPNSKVKIKTLPLAASGLKPGGLLSLRTFGRHMDKAMYSS